MSHRYIDLSDDEQGLEKIVNFLKDYGINSEYVNFHKDYDYSRTIQFEVDSQIYQILWFKNESSLKIGTSSRSGFLPFKYMYFDNTFPIVGGNKSIGFAHRKLENDLWRTFDYGNFHIPLEI